MKQCQDLVANEFLKQNKVLIPVNKLDRIHEDPSFSFIFHQELSKYKNMEPFSLIKLLIIILHSTIHIYTEASKVRWPLNLASNLKPITKDEDQSAAATLVIQRLLPSDKAALFHVKVSRDLKLNNETKAFGLLKTIDANNTTYAFITATSGVRIVTKFINTVTEYVDLLLK